MPATISVNFADTNTARTGTSTNTVINPARLKEVLDSGSGTNGGYVTLATAQTITGAKSFSALITASNSINISTGNLQIGGVTILSGSTNPYGNIRVLQNRSSTLSDGMYINYDSLGTTNAHCRIYANALNQRMIVRADTGRVGIGVNDPVSLLDVNGAIACGTIKAGRTAGIGTVELYQGAASQKGYVAWFRSNGQRAAYMGWNADVDTNISLVPELGNFSIIKSGGGGYGRVAPCVELKNTNDAGVYMLNTGTGGKATMFVPGVGGGALWWSLNDNPYADMALYPGGQLDVRSQLVFPDFVQNKISLYSNYGIGINGGEWCAYTAGNFTIRQSWLGGRRYMVVNLNDNGNGGRIEAATDRTDSFTRIIGRIANNNTDKTINIDTFGVDRFTVFSSGTTRNATNVYGQTSDQRLKQDIVLAKSQWDDVKNIEIYNYKFISDVKEKGNDAPTYLGPVAQQAMQVSPGLVSQNPDGTYDFKSSIFYMKAVKALQEALLRIEALEAKVQALELNQSQG